jgi:protein tyrosine/serine phosphatase
MLKGKTMSKRLIIRSVVCGVLLILLIFLLLTVYGNAFRKPYPHVVKKLCWIIGRPESAYNFGVVEAGHLYRSSAPDNKFVRFLSKSYKITRVISLRHGPLPYEKVAEELGIDRHIFQWSSTGVAPDPREIEKVFALMRDPQHVVLVHCGSGATRTGYIIARYRILDQKWTLEQAQKEINKFWHTKKNVYDRLLEEEFGKR